MVLKNLQIVALHSPLQLAKKKTAAVFNTCGGHRRQLDCDACSISCIDDSVITLKECFLFNLVPTNT